MRHVWEHNEARWGRMGCEDVVLHVLQNDKGGKVRGVFTPEIRFWIYGICVAAFGVLGVYGILNTEQIAAWGVLASAVCGMAMSNVDKEGSHYE